MFFCNDSICIEETSNKYKFDIKHLYLEQHNSYFTYIFSLYNISHSFENNKLSFNCLSVQTFKEYLIHNDFKDKLPYQEVIKLIYDIGILIKSLEKHNIFIFCFSLKDFIIIDNSIFLFINTNKLVKRHPNTGNIELKYPISIEKNTQFITHKINTNTIPFKCHYSYSYYNLGLMIFYLLTGHPYDTNNNKLLIPYIGTKIYFFLLRCLSDDDNKRCFLYI